MTSQDVDIRSLVSLFYRHLSYVPNLKVKIDAIETGDDFPLSISRL